MATGNIGKIGGVTEKILDKQKVQDFENLKENVSNEDASQFNNLMDSSIKPENKINIDDNEISIGKAQDNVGDKILNAFQNMKENIDTRHKDINTKLNSNENLSMQQMFQTQRAIANLTMTEDLIAKIVGKTTQNLDTLMKQQ